MTWVLPTPLLLFAGIVALLPVAALVRRPMSTPRLVVEAFVTALTVRAAVWAGCVAHRLIARRGYGRRSTWSGLHMRTSEDSVRRWV